MKKAILILICSLFLPFSSQSQYIFEKVCSFPYGNNDNEIGIRKEPDGTYGPTGFLNNTDLLYLLDAENNTVKIISNFGVLLNSIKVPSFSQDFYIENRILYILDLNNITSYDLLSKKALEKKNINGVFNKFSANDKKCELVKINSSSAMFTLSGDKNRTNVNFTIKENSNKLASITFLDSDSSGNYYFNEEVFITEIPCKVSRFILKYSAVGELLARIKLPDIYYCRLDNDITITPNGDIYHLIANKDSLEIIKWKNLNTIKQNDILTYPDKYNGRYHYNSEIKESPQGQKLNNSIESVPSENKLLVDRDESLQIADTYVQLVWTCAHNNISNGTVKTPDGKDLKTPEWILAGSNKQVPYQWGGFSTIAQFIQGLQNGKYAGDNVCTGNGSSTAVGVDCSGFVSRCWKLSSHYSTSMMPSILNSLASWTELKKGDAIHKVGHVRMSIVNNPNGTVNLVESSGKDWRVSYRAYNFTELDGYSPYRYKNMLDPQSGIDKNMNISKYNLYNNYPNPFNPASIISYQIPVASHVKLTVCDVLGNEIARLADENKPAGVYNIEFDGSKLTGGVYFYTLKAGDFMQTKKMVLVK
jgi:hypothetical protein